jgi:prepilin-type N-terminal cleavage/methylation domain-containing protein
MAQLLINSVIKAHSKEDEIRNSKRGCKMCCDNYFELSAGWTSDQATGGKHGLRKGFTLVEVLIVVVIISIAALMAVPMFSSAGSMQIRSAANIIAADLEYAKSMAITTGQNYAVIFDATAESYQVAIVNPDATTTVIPHPVKQGFDYVEDFKNDSRLSRVNISSVQFDPGSGNTITFDYLGSPYSGTDISNPLNSGSIAISADGATATISVEPVTGYITISN